MNPQPSRAPRRTLIIAVGLASLCLALALLFIRSRGQVDSLHRQSAALRAELDALQLKDHAPPANPSAEPPAPATLDEPRPATPPAPPSTGSSTSDARRQVNASDLSAMLKSPMMQKVMASQTSAIMQMTYGHLMNHLQLSQEERDYLQRLLVEKQTNLQNLGVQLTNPGLSTEERGSILQQLGEAWKSGEAKIHDFFNDEADFAYYQSYSRQEPERREVGMLEAALTGSDALDPSTADALAVLQNETRRKFPFTVDFYNQENFGNPAVLNPASVQTFLTEQTTFQAQVADDAARLLSAAQLQAFKQNQAAVRQMTHMQLNNIVQLTGGGQ